jgi:hypothetical protein
MSSTPHFAEQSLVTIVEPTKLYRHILALSSLGACALVTLIAVSRAGESVAWLCISGGPAMATTIGAW